VAAEVAVGRPGRLCWEVEAGGTWSCLVLRWAGLAPGGVRPASAWHWDQAEKMVRVGAGTRMGALRTTTADGTEGNLVQGMDEAPTSMWIRENSGGVFATRT